MGQLREFIPMNTPRYLLAKYIPDPLRMEPRNVGVVLWAEGKITARFVGESDAPDVRASLPQRLGIPDNQVYKKWIRYWREQMELPSLTRGADGRIVDRSAPEFLDALTAKSDFSFMLVPGGTLRTEVRSSELHAAIADLFERLVLEDADSAETKVEGESALLRREWNRIVTEAQLRSQPDFREDFEFLGLAKRKQRTFKFDAGIHPHFAVDARLAPRAVFQRVVLTKQSSVCTAAFMFGCMVEENKMPKERCAALVYATDDQLRRPEYRESFELMGECGRVVNLADRRKAVEQVALISA
jgi:hypothetical protein